MNAIPNPRPDQNHSQNPNHNPNHNPNQNQNQKTAEGTHMTTSEAGQPARCPVDHGAAAAPVVIPATALPGSKKHAVVQLFNYWTNPQAFIEGCRKEYGPRFQLSIRLPPRPVYVLTTPDDVKAMFTAPADVLHTGNGSATIEKYTGQSGLAWLDEDAHKARRKAMMPSYHGGALERISQAITETVKTDVATWPRNTPVQLHSHIHSFTMNVIREVIYGPKGPSRWTELHRLLLEMMEFNNGPVSPMLLHKMPARMVKVLRAIRPLGLERFLTLRDQVDALVYESIEEHRAAGYRGDDLLSELLEMTHPDGTPLTDSEIRDEMSTIFLAGTETTAAAIAWAFVYLARDKDVTARVREEMARGEETYLTAVVNEVLRLRPSIPNIIVREVKKPIEIGGVRYEPGQHLWASAFLLNRDPNLYEDPDVFRPERFLGVKPGTYSWIPFGGGRIRCLGDRIALLEMKAVIREVLGQCDLHVGEGEPERARSRIVVNVPSDFARMELRSRVAAEAAEGVRR
ncbi:putative cytochrome P450 137 [Streptomyces xanthophaeus]|uniref:Cytochrome P450 137 n=2 Tax=Streptomyces xanthophaeus TaxID=67385 RepID=A0A919H3Y6_9ACTN|nr:putative cytochrome P450 137 [Streptomyces xanthophaeus]